MGQIAARLGIGKGPVHRVLVHSLERELGTNLLPSSRVGEG